MPGKGGRRTGVGIFGIRGQEEERKEMPLENFEKLEEGIGRILESYEALKAENSELKETLKDRVRELDELRERVKKLDREKLQVREKVNTLLEKLHGLTQSA